MKFTDEPRKLRVKRNRKSAATKKKTLEREAILDKITYKSRFGSKIDDSMFME